MVAVDFLAVTAPDFVNVRFGSEAVIQPDSSRMAALGWKADIEPGRMSTLADTRHSGGLEWPDLNVC